MWVNLAQDAKVDFEMKIQRFQWNICAQTRSCVSDHCESCVSKVHLPAIFPSVPERVRGQVSVRRLHHQYYGVLNLVSAARTDGTLD